MTAIILELSGDSPLELAYYAESDIIRKVAHLIQPHLHRVTHLKLLQYHGESDHGTDPFFPHTIFPSLQDISTQYISPKDIVACLSHHEVLAPYKHLIEGDVFSVELKIKEKNLVSFQSTVISMENIQRLEDIPTLEGVSIFGDYEPSGDLSPPVKERQHKLGWKSLFISRFPWKRIQGILGRCTSLVSLSLMGIDETAALELAQMIPQLILLEEISVELDGDTALETPAISSGHGSDQTRIRTISLDLSRVVSNTEITGDILRLLLPISPRLEWLSLRGCRMNKLDFTEINKLKELRTLVLSIWGSTLEPKTTRLMLACPKLEMVQISGPTNALNSLGSSSARELDYEFAAMESSPIIKITGQDWPSLRSLTLSMDSTPTLCGLDSLRQLSLWSQSLVTTMILYLAMHPSELPLLETLDLHASPEWDILFIMLEKRLLTQTYGIKPIENLIFDRAISTRIKHSLASLLAGHILPRPSNYELSMQGNLELFLDTNIPGCVDCHLYLYPCDLVVLHTSPIGSVSTIEYPESVDEILRTQA
ncbi:hypothetical protein PIIN_10790, partial [Serendipita indica DSM 11827]